MKKNRGRAMPIQIDKALFSPGGKYRYLLTRNWAGSDHDRVCFIMLNPSTADVDNDDPTIKRCVRIARNFGGSLCVVNLFAFRATKPRELAFVRNPTGRKNDSHIIAAVKDSDLVIAAWGVEKPLHKPRAAAVRRLLLKAGVEVYCLGVNKDGSPRHPLLLKGKTPTQPYDLEA